MKIEWKDGMLWRVDEGVVVSGNTGGIMGKAEYRINLSVMFEALCRTTLHQSLPSGTGETK